MSLFDLLGMVAITGGVVLGVQAALDHGWGAVALGALGGAAIGYGAWVVVMLALFSVVWLFLQWRPVFPRCRSGRCRDRDYRYLYLDEPASGRDAELQQAHGGLIVRCRCGTRYLDSTAQHRFLELQEDGSVRPFMRYRPFRRWEREPG